MQLSQNKGFGAFNLIYFRFSENNIGSKPYIQQYVTTLHAMIATGSVKFLDFLAQTYSVTPVKLMQCVPNIIQLVSADNQRPAERVANPALIRLMVISYEQSLFSLVTFCVE